MSNNIEVVLVGNFDNGFIDSLPLEFGKVPVDKIHGGDQLTMQLGVFTLAIKSSEKTNADVKRTIELFQALGDEGTVYPESTCLVIDDDNDVLSGVYSI